MKVYVLSLVHPYEGSEVLGVYSNKDLAEHYKKLALESDVGRYRGDEYDIIETALDAPAIRG
jgi:hypothetical protein